MTNLRIAEYKGVESTDNSTTVSLGIGGVYTGEWEEIKDYASIRINIYSDQDAAEMGLDFQQSPDQTIIFDEPYGYDAGTHKLYNINPNAKYFRIVFTNGAVAQTTFSLQTIYGSVFARPTSHRLSDTLSGNDDTDVVKSAISFLNEVDDEYKNVGIQNPFPVDGDSVYAKDIWVLQSDIGDFSGSVTDVFDNLHTIITDVTATNPKELFIHFNRTMISNVIGLGAFSGDFSNVEIEIYNSGGVATTVIDESADATKYTSRTFQLPVTAGFNALKFSFHTTDSITLSNSVIAKTRAVVARLQAAKPDNTVTDINATTGGNLKISLEELESGISSNANSQLNVTPFAASGTEYLQDEISGSYTQISFAHHEIHDGCHFLNKDWLSLSNGQVYDILIVTPNTAKWGHFLFEMDSQAEANVSLYIGTTTSSDGTAMTVFNRNLNSVTANGILMYHTPTISAVGTLGPRYKLGSGNKIGGEVRASNEVILAPNTKYLFRITNDTALANWINWLFDWYEHVSI